MKKLILSILLLICCCKLYAQTPSYTDKLFYTCKLYGFVKYYHSEVSTCKVNWDSVLIDRLPAVKAAATKNDFNDVLMQMLDAAGPMAPAGTPLPDTLPAELKRNRDWGWTNDALLRSDVSTVLNNIKINFVPHNICWVAQNDYTNPNSMGLLLFPADYNYVEDLTSILPGEEKRLYLFFKYWNILNYFYPYKYALDTSLDETFKHVAPFIVAASTVEDVKEAFVIFNARLQDAHLENSTFRYPSFKYNAFAIPFTRYASGKYVASQYEGNIVPGDEIVTIDGLTTQQWEDSLRPYISAGNDVVFRRLMNVSMTAGPAGNITVGYKDSLGNVHTENVARSQGLVGWPFLLTPEFKRKTKKKYFSCGIVYLNPAFIPVRLLDQYYQEIKNYPYLVIDLRYSAMIPYESIPKLCSLLYQHPKQFVKFTGPNAMYPGTYYYKNDTVGYENPDGYNGKVILLTYEDNQSYGEYITMSLQQLPNVITVGTQTAGTDGNISIANNIIQGESFHFTSLGVYYPNGDSTQRIGVGPRKPGDVLVQLTQEGIRDGRDEILEAALKAAGCPLSTEEVIQVMNEDVIYPNPATNTFSIKAENNSSSTIKVYSLTGQLMLVTQETQNINIAHLPAGIYMVQITNNGKTTVEKLIKE